MVAKVVTKEKRGRANEDVNTRESNEFWRVCALGFTYPSTQT